METTPTLVRVNTDDAKMRWAFLFAALNVLDGLQTTAIVGRFGVRAELNPWIGWCIENYSILGLWVVKLVIMAVILAVVHRLSVRILCGVTLGLAVIVSANFITLLKQF
ncbi:MAG: DUF5658 family protein [Planctomycetota bacterium]